MLRLLARNWWALALRGLFAVIFGAVALFTPGITLQVLIVLFGAYALADGVFAIVGGVRAARAHERWGPLVIEGIACVVAGLISLFVPLAAALAFVYLFAAWALITGIVEIAAAIRLRREIEGEWLLVLGGVLSVALGIVTAIFPGLGLIGLVWTMGVYALAFGIVLIVLGFRLRRRDVPDTAAARG